VRLAPIGAFGAMAFTVGAYGLTSLWNLIALIATFYLTSILFVLIVLGAIARIAGFSIIRFILYIKDELLIVLGTSSSETVLPQMIQKMEHLGASRPVVGLVIPTGYSFNLDGSTLYLSLASVFVAQAAGIHMSFGEQLMMVLTLMLTSKGVAGVPRAAFVIMLATADSFHLPAWPIYAIFGVDQLMDMARTSINVMGNCLASAVVARWEGALGKESPSPNVVDAVAE
jgi:aerobic C4-dicarboxylate transport protein